MKIILYTLLVILSVAAEVFKEYPHVQIGIRKRADGCTYRSRSGDVLYVHYKGSLEDGTVFDTSKTTGTPFKFTLGKNQVVKGWDYGMFDMCVGEKRRLTIPPKLAYGEIGSGELIPPNATLYFDVELVKLTKKDEL